MPDMKTINIIIIVAIVVLAAVGMIYYKFKPDISAQEGTGAPEQEGEAAGNVGNDTISAVAGNKTLLRTVSVSSEEDLSKAIEDVINDHLAGQE